jgi:hypothetical protein
VTASTESQKPPRGVRVTASRRTTKPQRLEHRDGAANPRFAVPDRDPLLAAPLGSPGGRGRHLLKRRDDVGDGRRRRNLVIDAGAQ